MKDDISTPIFDEPAAGRRRQHGRANPRLRDSEERLEAELSGSRLLQRLSTRLIPEQSPEALYDQILDTALELMRADAVSIQLLDDDGKRLRRVATRNLHPDSTEYWTWVDASHASTCGQALSKNERVVVEDVEASPELAGTGDLEAFRASGTRAVQSTPLLTRSGRPVGMISTHWRAPRRIDEGDFGLFDILAREVADLFERSKAEVALRESEERQAFLLRLGDEMRAHSSPDEIIATATRELGERLQASRIVYAEIDEEAGVARIREGWTADGAEQHPAELKLSDFGGPLLDDLHSGKTVRYDDVGEPPYDRSDLAALARIGVGAGLSVPLLVNGRFVVNLNVHQDRPRVWTDAEIALTEAVAERTWAAVERARAERAMRVSEEKYRTLFETMGQGYCELELIRDEHGKAVDQLYLELNPAFERLFGVAAAAAKGRRASEVFPFVDPLWTERFDEVVTTGTYQRFEHQHGPLQQWFEVFVYPRGGDRVVVLYEEITDRKRAEIALRESEQRQAFLLALGDAMRPEPAAEGKIAVAARLLGEKLDASRVLYAEYDHEKGLAHIFSGWLADGAQPFPSVVKLEDFEGDVLNDLREGRVVRVDDVGRLEPRSGYAAIANVGVQALLSPPLLVDGKLKFNVSIHQHDPRHWTDDEVALVQEVSERLWAEIVRARAEEAVRESEQHQRLLLAELQHRVRNTLAVVRSIARRTADNSTTVEQMIAHFEGRLDAFSRVQSAVTRSADGLIELTSLIEDEMVAHATREGEQLRIKGPAVAIDSRTAERLSLAIHELTTNAVKHGALMTENGTVWIRWALAAAEDGDMLQFHWTESGVHNDLDAPRREGFGMELLLRSLPYDLQAESTLELRSDGLDYLLRLPLPRRS